MKTVFSVTLFALVLALSLSSCRDDDSPEILTKSKLSGFIQKGPFLNGTSISISELKTDLSQTGKSFNSQIKDNQGTFELANIQLSSPFVELKADGFYFNEVTGETSKSQISLFALADVSSISTLNVNVLSTLEKARVENLVAKGLSFTDAKKKAMEEILAIFSFNKNDIQSSELLDINKSGDDNAILLAISSILQGYRTEAELSELLANLSADISTDGKLDSEVLGTSLISQAKFLNMPKIRENLAKRYSDIGATLQIPEFEKYVAQFVEKSTFNVVSLITYPEINDGILNILNEKNSTFKVNRDSLNNGIPVSDYYYFSVVTQKGISLKIEMRYIEGGNPTPGFWGSRIEAGTNWMVRTFDFTTNSQIWEVVETGKPSNLKVSFFEGQGAKIRISYFENNDLVAARSRIITVN